MQQNGQGWWIEVLLFQNFWKFHDILLKDKRLKSVAKNIKKSHY